MIVSNLNEVTRKLDKVVKDLGYISSVTFLRSLGLKKYADETLDYVLDIFPVSDKPASLREFPEHLAAGWKVKFSNTENKLGISIENSFAATSRGQTVLKSLDTGSKAYTFTPKDPIHFISELKFGRSRGSQWVTLAAGEPNRRPAREGIQYTAKTKNYVAGTIVPQLREEILAKMAARLNR